MTKPKPIRYPIGRQVFEEIRHEGFLYVDKTEYVYNMTHAGGKYCFLSRPRRFGKTLLTNTLHSYFEGRRDLFEGLAIEKLEQEWEQYPVLHFDMSLGKHMNCDALNRYLHSILDDNEKHLGITAAPSVDTNIRLKNLIMEAHAKTGKGVVVLIDEYDAHLLDTLHQEETLEALRDVMRNFYSPLKACDKYLRFVFLTGITKFSQLSIFSELNNITNISMRPEYAAICGISEEEMLTQMDAGLDDLATAWQVDKENVVKRLKAHYDGYHFCWPSPDIYNPFSLLQAFANKSLESYWFGTGTPTYLVNMLRKHHVTPISLNEETYALAEDFDAPTERMTSIIPLLYQSGYITIKDGEPMYQTYTLGIPNREVRMGLMRSLIPYYLTPDTQVTSNALIKMSHCLRRGDMEGALQLLQTFLSTILYTDHTDYEGHYQQVFYIIFSLLGMYVDVEVHTPRGRMDVVMRTADTLYIIELKLNKDAATALAQIDLKQYAERFALCGLPVVKVGINFDTERRTISDWQIG